MKIVLINPINRSYVVMPSIGLGYLARQLLKDKNEVKILNCLKEEMTFDTFEAFVRGEHYDVYGFQMFSYDFSSVKKHLEIVKFLNPKAITILGGAHPSGDPYGVLKSLDKADFAFYGEAEIGIRKLIQNLTGSGKNKNLQAIPGLIWRNDDEVVVNPREFVNDLDSLDFPAWDLQKPEEYPRAPHGAFAKNFPTAPIIITRSCPFQCAFCAGKSISGRKLRKRSVDNAIEEIKYLHKNFNVKEIHIEDECFTIHKSLVLEFCDKLIKSKTVVTWGLPSGIRLDTIDRELLKTMEEAGCYSVAVGVEFGSQRILNLAKKSITLELIKEKVALLNETKIKTTGFFMLGFPGETKEEIQSTIDLSLQLDLDRAQFNNFMPLPGSELWAELEKKGMLSNVDFDKFFVHNVACVPDGMKESDMKWFQRKAYISFYLRPKIIIKLLKEITSIAHLKHLVVRFIDALK
ncbi:MAG: B12-binding domain-containing radical SAM protein [Elusimicrobia bacterium]|nr:B12-binding domain-containing radical SAM protein [Elusimicrobiota bacterium]